MGVPLAWRNVMHEKGKLVLSASGVAAALVLIVLLIGFRDGMYATMTAYYDNLKADLVVAQSDTSLSGSIPLSLHDKLAALSGAIETDHASVASVIFTHGATKTAIALIGYNPSTGLGGPWKLADGRGVQSDDEIVLDFHLAHDSGVAIGDAVEVLGRSFTVVGLSRDTNSWLGSYVFISRQAAEALLGLPGMTSFFALRLPAGADVTVAARAIEAEIPGVRAVSPATVGANARKSVGSILDSTLNALLLIAVVTAIAVMGLTAYTAVVDRMREYGVLKAIGSDGRRMARLVVLETLYRAVAGFGLGVALSFLAADLIGRVVIRWTVLIRPETFVSAGLAALIMTVLAALLPLRRIAAIDPAEVFKA